MSGGNPFMKDDSVYLHHILECIAAIQSYTKNGKKIFLSDRKTQKATLRELQELSESTQRLSAELKDYHPEIPWHDISGFRNIVVHNYLGLNVFEIWGIIERDLPPLQKAVESILREKDTPE
jgi:uncharacterized protein with HEPN domain